MESKNQLALMKLAQNHGEDLSICKCGHTGDRPEEAGDGGNHFSLHRQYGMGHGACRVEGCKCEHFSWRKFTDEFQKKIALTTN